MEGQVIGRRATREDPLRIGILVSGRGSNMAAIVEAAQRGEIPVRPVVVISDRPEAPALERARSMGVSAVALDFRAASSPDEYYERLLACLRGAQVELVVLAGYMRILPRSFVQSFAGRIINIHPSLLPAFPGLRPHQQALEHGVKLSGATVHLVDEGVDSGPILLQEAVPVWDDDDAERLSERILEVEHRLYPRALALIATGRLRLVGRRVMGAAPKPSSDAGRG